MASDAKLPRTTVKTFKPSEKTQGGTTPKTLAKLESMIEEQRGRTGVEIRLYSHEIRPTGYHPPITALTPVFRREETENDRERLSNRLVWLKLFKEVTLVNLKILERRGKTQRI
ncbi:hypothetical protein VNI00_017310 [Paramarasmius palmivorus]|uniref:Uncharacterized protein n=1 Tax=Paramarasmius palmivorus TaxID=297713 RepID=A0AAW0B7I7_9AGAR